ncbi:NUDIX domain-containing protein [Glutamicibacter sp. AOP38-B1-38]|uniref:NUDIX domain-containing protein n=1 Tax=Glutamicibacter sp. AOP38-B1-38 TaxID=3457680 RepID=UPI00403461FD
MNCDGSFFVRSNLRRVGSGIHAPQDEVLGLDGGHGGFSEHAHPARGWTKKKLEFQNRLLSAGSTGHEAGQVLAVRKRGTATFMVPGGKPEPGESPLDAGVREVSEELGSSSLFARHLAG